MALSSRTSVGPRRPLWLGLLMAAAVAFGSARAARSATAADCPACPTTSTACITLPRAQDQLWLISDRALGCADVDARGTNLEYWRYANGAGWQRGTSAEFFASDDAAVATHVWVHGNRIDRNMAFQTTWTAYSAIARQLADPRPLRFVGWSWPSERVDTGQMEDIRIKAGRTSTSSRHLARFLDCVKADVPISLSGYSFGARIITGSLHLLAGGVLDGRRMAFTTAAQRPRMDTILIAAAIDNDWLLPGHCHGNALAMVDRMLLVNNSCDRALKRYHWLYGRRSCAEGLGYTGLVGANQLGPAAAKISQFDACCFVGPEHDWTHYFCSPEVVARMLPFVLPRASSA